MSISNEQLAELIVGFAKSQNAIIDALVHHLGKGGTSQDGVVNREGVNFRMRSVIPTLQSYAHIDDRSVPPTFQDLPSRVLLQLQGSSRDGAMPVHEWLSQELDRLTTR
jgi:hypothetical protein